MIREATAMTVRQNLGAILNEVQYRHDSVLITKGGKPVAALVDIGLFEKIRLMRAEFDRMSGELATVYSGVEQATAEAEIGEAVAAAKSR
ncbi:MAG: type II toxin-antitoxin system Phd/YefM family antitoxin [Gammaproteobacteria bacterium]